MRILPLVLFLVGCPGKEGGDTADTADTGDGVDTGGTDTADTADSGDTGDTDTAVPPTTLVDDFEDDLSRIVGCADVEIAVSNPDDTVALFFENHTGLAEAACLAGETQVHTFALPHADVDLRVDVGRHVTAYACNDAIEFEPEVLRTWVATAGTATLQLEPTSGADCGFQPYANATLMLEDVTLAPTDGGTDTATLVGMTLYIFVGWLPG